MTRADGSRVRGMNVAWFILWCVCRLVLCRFGAAAEPPRPAEVQARILELLSGGRRLRAERLLEAYSSLLGPLRTVLLRAEALRCCGNPGLAADLLADGVVSASVGADDAAALYAGLVDAEVLCAHGMYRRAYRLLSSPRVRYAASLAGPLRARWRTLLWRVLMEMGDARARAAIGELEAEPDGATYPLMIERALRSRDFRRACRLAYIYGPDRDVVLYSALASMSGRGDGSLPLRRFPLRGCGSGGGTYVAVRLGGEWLPRERGRVYSAFAVALARCVPSPLPSCGIRLVSVDGGGTLPAACSVPEASTVVVDSSLMRLDDRALAALLAHELSHLAARGRWGWRAFEPPLRWLLEGTALFSELPPSARFSLDEALELLIPRYLEDDAGLGAVALDAGRERFDPIEVGYRLGGGGRTRRGRGVACGVDYIEAFLLTCALDPSLSPAGGARAAQEIFDSCCGDGEDLFPVVERVAGCGVGALAARAAGRLFSSFGSEGE